MKNRFIISCVTVFLPAIVFSFIVGLSQDYRVVLVQGPGRCGHRAEQEHGHLGAVLLHLLEVIHVRSCTRSQLSSVDDPAHAVLEQLHILVGHRAVEPGHGHDPLVALPVDGHHFLQHMGGHVNRVYSVNDVVGGAVELLKDVGDLRVRHDRAEGCG